MIAATAALAIKISFTAIRPGRSALFRSNWATTPRSEFASMGTRLHLTVCWESIYHTVHGLARVVGVQGADHGRPVSAQ